MAFLRIESIILQKVLTIIVVNAIIIHDKKSCQNDKNICRRRKGVNPMPLSNRLKEYRAKKNINQQELGSLVGASRQTISLIERGDYSPSVTLAIKRK